MENCRNDREGKHIRTIVRRAIHFYRLSLNISLKIDEISLWYCLLGNYIIPNHVISKIKIKKKKLLATIQSSNWCSNYEHLGWPRITVLLEDHRASIALLESYLYRNGDPNSVWFDSKAPGVIFYGYENFLGYVMEVEESYLGLWCSHIIYLWCFRHSHILFCTHLRYSEFSSFLSLIFFSFEFSHKSVYYCSIFLLFILLFFVTLLL